MSVTCPHCATRYTLPEALLGPGGARVRCPRCREPFAVGPDGAELLAPPAVMAESEGLAPLAEELPAGVADGVNLSVAQGDTPPVAEDVAPPIAQSFTSPIAQSVAPSVAEGAIPPVVNGAAATAHAGPPMLPQSGALIDPEGIEGEVHAFVEEAMGGEASPNHLGRDAAARVPDASSPEAIARAIIDELHSHSGEAISTSYSEGRLFREFGAVITEAYEFYRRRVGSNADPAPFRAALRERWGVDLEPGNPPKRLI